MSLFLGPCDFFWGAPDPAQLPEISLPEIAFAGRSNVGKSSLINALTNRKALARTSKTPGRTQQLNFFNLGDRLTFVDMPGYGFAQVSKTQKAEWQDLIKSYLSGRPTLRCVLLLIDSRHGIKDVDQEIMKMLDASGVSYRIILTKCDKANDLDAISDKVREQLKKHTAAYPEVMATSAEEKIGIDDVREFIASFALPPIERQ